MQIKSAEFIISAAQPAQFPNRPIPHIVFAGKSNVGKSSLLNKLLNRKSLAKTSSTPGKTRLINFFLINDAFFFVDLPGYGFARVSKKERHSWQGLIESYLTTHPYLAQLILLIDIRHPLGQNDQQMLNWLHEMGFQFQVVLTKADKLNNQEAQKQRQLLASACGIPLEDCLVTSSEKGTGIAPLWKSIQEHIAQAAQLIKETP